MEVLIAKDEDHSQLKGVRYEERKLIRSPDEAGELCREEEETATTYQQAVFEPLMMMLQERRDGLR